MRTVITLDGQHAIAADLNLAPGTTLGDFTLSCMVRTAESGPLFFYHAAVGGLYFGAEITESGHLRAEAGKGKKGVAIESAQGGLRNAEWHRIAVVKKGPKLALFAEGEPVPMHSQVTSEEPEAVHKDLLVGRDGAGKRFLVGEVGDVSVWNRALTEDELRALMQRSPKGNETGLLFFKGMGLAPNKGQEVKLPKGMASLPSQSVSITFVNDSFFDFVLQSTEGNLGAQLPKLLPRLKTTVITLTPDVDTLDMEAIGNYATKTSPDIPSGLTLHIFKSLTQPYKSYLKAPIQAGLDSDISVQASSVTEFKATLRVCLNLVILKAIHVTEFINAARTKIGKDKVLTNIDYQKSTGGIYSTGKQVIDFYQASLLFNRRIVEVPSAIVLCTSVKDVQETYKLAKKYDLPVSVRSGGHDHEGESSGTGTVLIDMMGLSGVSFEPPTTKDVALIGAGNRFITLTTALANNSVMIPHGTCATVALPGFIMGGGWGPWTRKMGMSCERIVGAEIVLGNGEVVRADADNHSELLWAIKGGGGLSYGIVTKFWVKTFPLPEQLIKFELEWNPYPKGEKDYPKPDAPTVRILKAWENVISTVYHDPAMGPNTHGLKPRPKGPNASQLNGTNLKINGRPLKETQLPNGEVVVETFDPEKVSHNCVMYGYWQGRESELKEFVDQVFGKEGVPPAEMRIDGVGGMGTRYGDQLMDSWGRESLTNVKLKAEGKPGLPFPPDLDEPAPHKITSRLVEKQGLGVQGHAALLRSLTSTLILPGNRDLGLFQYVTLGAIVGDYYANLPKSQYDQSAFPYKDRLYTIQYQTWWNTKLSEKEEGEHNEVHLRTNRALDWMEKSRDFAIPNTSGAFISFKDSSIPTETYFGSSYQQLKAVKERYSQDKDNRLRSRKTII